MKSALLLGLVLITGGSHAFAADAKAKAPAQRAVIPGTILAGLAGHTNLTYARHGERRLQLDLYRPKDVSQPFPAIICIHGVG